MRRYGDLQELTKDLGPGRPESIGLGAAGRALVEPGNDPLPFPAAASCRSGWPTCGPVEADAVASVAGQDRLHLVRQDVIVRPVLQAERWAPIAGLRVGWLDGSTRLALRHVWSISLRVFARRVGVLRSATQRSPVSVAAYQRTPPLRKLLDKSIGHRVASSAVLWLSRRPKKGRGYGLSGTNLQAIANPSLGQDIPWMRRIWLELESEVTNCNSQIFYLRATTRFPNGINDLSVSEDIASAFCKDLQDFVRLECEVYKASVQPDTSTQKIDLKIVAHDNRRLALLERPAAQCVHSSCQQFLHTKRLLDVVVGTRLQGLDQHLLFTVE